MPAFREYADYMRQYFCMKVQKIPVNAGCTCPNRDGTIGRSGCVYCNNRSFSPAYGRGGLDVTQQLEAGKRFYAHKYPAMKYLAYFQSHTNTYGDESRLIQMYDEALAVSHVVGLVVATRPDCMSESLLDYFAQVARRRYVCIEYGVESVNDSTLRRIRRGHDVACAADAIRRTAARQIQVGVHFMLGLPGDTRADWLQQARWVSDLPVNLLKLHQLQVIRDTPLAAEFRRNPSAVTLFSAEAYAAVVAEYLEHLSPHVVVERFTSQAPPAWVLAPRWGLKNGAFVRLLRAHMRERHAWQGRCCQSGRAAAIESADNSQNYVEQQRMRQV